MALFNRVTIVGLGLIGGSLGMALRRKRLAREVIGISRRHKTLARAKRRGAIDIGSTDARRAIQDVDLVVLATPVDTIVPQAKRLIPLMRRGSILIDVGSTKVRIVQALEQVVPRHVAFVGCHPLAGSEQRGIDAARAELFDGSSCVVTVTRRTNRRALALVTRFWKKLVRRVVVMDPRTHDRLLAQVSHLPHLVAFSLVEAANYSALQVASRSFLDATRVAKSDPNLWDDIFLSNRHALLAAIDRFDRHWRALRHHLAHGDRAALRRFLHRAQSTRHALQDS